MFSLLRRGGSGFRALFASAVMCTSACAGITTPEVITVPAGNYRFGSSSEEREYAYQLDERAYGHSVTRNSGWYANEPALQTLSLGEYHITATPITNRQYQQFVLATGHPAPNVDKQTWQGYGLVHPFSRTARHRWNGNNFPDGREAHPVVLVSHNDATAYAKWMSKEAGEHWRLPTEHEWVKAARGPNGSVFPWGNEFDAEKLNSHDSGPFDTVPVGSRSTSSPFGLVDPAGQVFEWILSPSTAKRSWVKGGSWDDKGCGVCRPAARHSRPKTIKHILIGFRLVKE